MINKEVASVEEAVSSVRSDSVVLVGGFGDIGVPLRLVEALSKRKVRGLTVVSNNAGTGDRGLSLLFREGMVRKIIASFPSQVGADHFLNSYRRGEVTVELVPQGTLAERLRAGGSGIAGFYTPTAFGTELAEGKEVRNFDGVGHIFETAIRGDFALVCAHHADRYGNLRYRLASRNFNPLMAMAAAFTIAEVTKTVDLGEIGPDDVHTPGVFVDSVVECSR